MDLFGDAGAVHRLIISLLTAAHRAPTRLWCTAAGTGLLPHKTAHNGLQAETRGDSTVQEVAISLY